MLKEQYKNIKIKDCAHCGCNAVADKAQDARCRLFYFVKCSGYKCGSQIRAETKGEAVERWNKRFKNEE